MTLAILISHLAGALLLIGMAEGRFNSPHGPGLRTMMFGLDALEYEYLANRTLSRQLDEESSRHYGHVVLRNAAMSIGDAHQVSLLARAGVVKCLDLHRCFVIGDGLASMLSAALTNTSKVEWISAHHCNLNEVVLSRMKTYMPYFEKKDGGSEEATADSAGVVGRRPSSNGLKKQGGGKGSASKLASNPHLKVLDLSFSSLDSKAYRAIATIVSQSSSLEVLVLDGNRMHGDDVRSIIHSSRRHPCLKHLSLSGCKLSDECMEFVSFGVKSNANITHLDLSSNDITPLGFQILINAMEQGACRSLRHLDVSYNSLGDEGVAALARCLARGKLPSLESLVLREVDAGQRALLELMNALGSNTSYVADTLHTFDISGNALEATASKASKGSYYDKLGKTLGIDPSKFTKEGATEYLSSTAAAATPVINDGLAKLSSGISSLGSMLETGADAGLKLLTGEEDYSDAGVIRVDKNSGGYGYGVTYGKSKRSGRFNDRPVDDKRRKRRGKGKGKGKSKGRKVVESQVMSAARKKSKARREEGADTDAEEKGQVPVEEAEAEMEAPGGRGGGKSRRMKEGKSEGKRTKKSRGSKGKKRLRSVGAVLALVRSLPQLRLLGLARCGLTEKWCAQLLQRSPPSASSTADVDTVTGGDGGDNEAAHVPAVDSTDTEAGEGRPRVALLLCLNGLSEEAQSSAKSAIRRVL